VKQLLETFPWPSASEDLEPGPGFTPLRGIDIPFHSSLLKANINLSRDIIRERIDPKKLDLQKLVGRFIPNVIGEPFALNRECIEKAAKITKSEKLLQLLQKASHWHKFPVISSFLVLILSSIMMSCLRNPHLASWLCPSEIPLRKQSANVLDSRFLLDTS
jgi:hypothetical protein